MKRLSIIALVLTVLLHGVVFAAETAKPDASGKKSTQPKITIANDMGKAMRREAVRVGAEFQKQARSLFSRSALGWDKTTLVSIYRFALALPLKVPVLVRQILAQGRALGVVGSFLVLIFLLAVIYALAGQRRVMLRVEKSVFPLKRFIPQEAFPYFLSVLKIVVASLIPLVLLGVYSLINAFIRYRAPWFLLIGRLLGVWSIGALVLNLLREGLTSGLYPAADAHGDVLYRRSRLAVFYILGGTALVWGAEAFTLPADIAAFLQFVISTSVVCVLLLLFFNKRSMLSLLPELPYQNYRTFRKNLERYYLPAVYMTFFIGLLWCIGYRRFSEAVLTKTWAVAGVYVGFLVIFHLAQARLARWSRNQAAAENEDARLFFKSLRKLLLYLSVACAAIIILNLVGLSDPLVRLCSFPIIKAGKSPLTLWLLIKALMVFVAILYSSGLLRTYLNFKVYPSVGVDTGLAYALNTFLKFLFFFIAFLATLRTVGLSPQVLMVFAGGAGIGLGLGLQNMAANLVSGLSLVFGQRVRKGDWVQVGQTMGVVTDIFLHATKVMTRDNVEHLIPNSEFLSKTITNYTLSSPTIRLSVPVGISYDADPLKAQELFLAAAQRHPELVAHRPPEVRFTGYGDNSINFEVLIWIDIRKMARRKAKSLLYFTMFEMLKQAGVEIPYPQRDIHIRSGLVASPPGRTPA